MSFSQILNNLPICNSKSEKSVEGYHRTIRCWWHQIGRQLIRFIRLLLSLWWNYRIILHFSVHYYFFFFFPIKNTYPQDSPLLKLYSPLYYTEPIFNYYHSETHNLWHENISLKLFFSGQSPSKTDDSWFWTNSMNLRQRRFFLIKLVNPFRYSNADNLCSWKTLLFILGSLGLCSLFFRVSGWGIWLGNCVACRRTSPDGWSDRWSYTLNIKTLNVRSYWCSVIDIMIIQRLLL